MARLQQFLRLCVPALAALFVAGCGGGGSGAESAERSGASDADVAALVYAGTPRTPAGFLDDAAPPSFTQVTTYHVKTNQIDPDAATVHELCTDDWSEAFDWTEQVAEQAPAYLDLVGNVDDSRFHEFDRVPRDHPDRYVRMRVYRCTYLDRSNVDAARHDGQAGIVNERPLDAPTLRRLSEYLWHFSQYNNSGHVVLESAALTQPGVVGHRITIASLETGAAPGGCDLIEVRDWTHTVDPATGTLLESSTLRRNFAAQRVGEAVLGC
jgi:hypothetical protein